MRLDPKTYPGDSILHLETGISAGVVRSNLFTRSVPIPALDLSELERQARAAQSEWLARNLKSYFAALVRTLRAKSNFSAATSALNGVKNEPA